MKFEIVVSPGAAKGLAVLKPDVRSGVRDRIELHLRHEPTKLSKSRIKRLRGLLRPQYRLRVDEIRVFYDVTASTVEVLAIITKAEARAWLDDGGTPDSERGSGGGER